MKVYNMTDGMVRLVPDEGKTIYDKRTKTTRSEVVCDESEVEMFAEVDAE